MTRDDLDWLAAERPEPIHLDDTTTALARDELMNHIAGPVRDDAPIRSGRRHDADAARRSVASTRRGTARRRWALRAGMPVAVSAGAVAAVLALTGGAGAPLGHRTPVGHPGVSATVKTHHGASPLLRLAGYVADDSTPSGDATLVLRTTTVAGHAPTTGADLYTDDGRYFYSDTESGLPTAISSGDDVGNGFNQRERIVAQNAADGDLSVARRQMADAAYDNGVEPAAGSASAQSLAVAKEKFDALLAQTTDPAKRAQLKQEEADAAHPTAAQQQLTTDNRIWENSMDALTANAENPLVRAGVLRLLSTLSDVTVVNQTVAGQPALVITAGAGEMGPGYQEQLTVNATTGVPIAFAGGTPGQTPEVTVAYAAARVTVADISAGNFPSITQP